MSPTEPLVFHVDMDAFFASVEVRDDPSLRGKPVLVGGGGRRGVISAASYEARKYGCRSAQPTAIALRKCPQAVLLPPRISAYSEASAQAFSIFDRFSPAVEGLSIDEAFLDMAGTQRLLGPPREAAESLRAAVAQETGGLTCSVGISAVKFISKIASAMHKPDAITEVPRGTELEFLEDLPISKLWGVGPKSAERLRARGIRTVGGIRALGRERLVSMFGENGLQLDRLANAVDARGVETGRRRKSVSHEDTYVTDVRGADEIKRNLLSQATRVADRLVAKGIRGKRIQLKIRDTDFKTETRQRMLEKPTDRAKVIYDAACSLLENVEVAGRAFRLTGVGVSGFDEEPTGPQQLQLLPDAEDPADARGQDLQDVLSAVRSRFGHQALYPADASAKERRGSSGALSKTVDDDAT